MGVCEGCGHTGEGVVERFNVGWPYEELGYFCDECSDEIFGKSLIVMIVIAVVVLLLTIANLIWGR